MKPLYGQKKNLIYGSRSGGRTKSDLVLESMGPEGKVRGTMPQILERYTSLAREYAGAGDAVLSERFFQHAEHYRRLLTESQTSSAPTGEKRIQRRRFPILAAEDGKSTTQALDGKNEEDKALSTKEKKYPEEGSAQALNEGRRRPRAHHPRPMPTNG